MREGLEVVWWITDDSSGQVGWALAQHTEPPLPSDELLRERWRRSGLRMVSVPLSDLTAVRASLPPDARTFTQSVGWATNWTEIFRGRRIGGAPIILDGKRTTPPAGVARLLARCWPLLMAGPSHAARLRLEMVFQIERPKREGAEAAFETPTIPAEETLGDLILELTYEAVVDADRALVITCEAPETEWKPPDLSAEPDDFDISPEPDGEEPDRSVEEEKPLPAPILTFGEAVLSSEAADSSTRRQKVVILLVPRLPDRMTLLP